MKKTIKVRYILQTNQTLYTHVETMMTEMKGQIVIACTHNYRTVSPKVYTSENNWIKLES